MEARRDRSSALPRVGLFIPRTQFQKKNARCLRRLRPSSRKASQEYCRRNISSLELIFAENVVGLSVKPKGAPDDEPSNLEACMLALEDIGFFVFGRCGRKLQAFGDTE